MRYFLIAGERSGDLHGSRLINAIAEKDENAQFIGIGGDEMAEAGMVLLIHYRSMSFMGIWEILKHLPTVLGNFRRAKALITSHQPDVLVLIDFAAFNLKIASYAKSINLSTAYYIAPKAWAWNAARVKTIRKSVDKLLCILPFEVDFFASRGLASRYVGNPVQERIDSYDEEPLDIRQKTPVIAFLPGSRAHEVGHALGVLKALAQEQKEWTFVVAAVQNLPIIAYRGVEDLDNVQIFVDRAYDLLKSSDVAIVTSGTATLETALLRVPQVVVYRTSWITYWIARGLVKVPYLSLVNLIANKSIVKEYVQSAFNHRHLGSEIQKILHDTKYRLLMEQGYDEVEKKLGHLSASDRAAAEVVALARQET